VILANPKHEQFAQLIASGRGQADAAREVGYSGKHVDSVASRLVKKSQVAARIAELSGEITEAAVAKSGVSKAWILQHLGQMLTADLADICTDTGAFKQLQEWPVIWRQMLTGCDIEELFDMQADADTDRTVKVRTGQVKKIKFLDRLRAVELTGKELGMFGVKVQHSGPNGGPIPVNTTLRVEFVKSQQHVDPTIGPEHSSDS
jgi:phage terminase small subunit